MRHPAQLPNVNHFLTTLHEGTGRHTYSPVLFKSHLFHLSSGAEGGSRTHDLPITKRPNLAYVVVKYRCDASVLVHFRGFREASVQQFVQQPRGDVSRDYLASLRRSRTASTRIKMRRVPRSACSALRTRTCRYQSTSEPRPHSFPAESLRRSRRSRNL